jgi:hypothetical protein
LITVSSKEYAISLSVVLNRFFGDFTGYVIAIPLD